MNRRFTGDELFELRNLIPINWLIKEHLNIPSKDSEGFFRFLCPLCNEFQTATNPKTNLARCFRCETNFNPIDLVMTVKGIGFVESVKYLKTFLPGTPDSRPHGQAAGIGWNAGEYRQTDKHAG
ncbi:MAG: hypothetical protein KAR13_18115 [Desulfobulbaceae bacterium]|nr:hypothetical protein [Desulfobulbaceae bacterium]